MHVLFFKIYSSIYWKGRAWLRDSGSKRAKKGRNKEILQLLVSHPKKLPQTELGPREASGSIQASMGVTQTQARGPSSTALLNTPVGC